MTHDDSACPLNNTTDNTGWLNDIEWKHRYLTMKNASCHKTNSRRTLNEQYAGVHDTRHKILMLPNIMLRCSFKLYQTKTDLLYFIEKYIWKTLAIGGLLECRDMLLCGQKKVLGQKGLCESNCTQHCSWGSQILEYMSHVSHWVALGRDCLTFVPLGMLP